MSIWQTNRPDIEETARNPLHPSDPLARARERGWIEFGSSVLNDTAGLYNAKDRAGFEMKSASLAAKFERIDAELVQAPWFAGERFGLVDAAFGPVFRYFDGFDRIDRIDRFDILDGKSKVLAWRSALARRPSIQSAVTEDYGPRLDDFLLARNSFISALMKSAVHA